MNRWHELLDAQCNLRPMAPAFSDTAGNNWSYRALSTACDALGAELMARGVVAGDRVVVLAENCCAAVAALFACSRIGAVAVPVNARMRESEVRRILDHARPAALLASTEVSKEAMVHANRLDGELIEGAWGQLHLAQPFPSNPQDNPELAVLLYTTGTTGDPKGVMLSHTNMRFGGKTSAQLRGMTEDDVIYGVLPITHVFGLASVVTAAIFAGAQVRLEARFAPAKLYQALQDGVTLLSAVPQMHALLMQYTHEQGFDKLQGGALRYVSSGAAPLDPDWKHRAEAFYGVALQNGYGMTESTAGISATRSRIGNPDISVGPALPGVEICLDAKVEGGGDGLGEVLTRGPHVMLGYYRNHQETERAVSADGWLRTGDLGRINDQGLLNIEGRAKELIIHGGFNVFPPEVEAALNAHPQVVQSAVVGRLKGGDEQVLAFVQVAVGDSLDVEVLRAFVAERLSGYKRPAQIVTATSLPAAPTGKILKHKLLDHFAEQLS